MDFPHQTAATKTQITVRGMMLLVLWKLWDLQLQNARHGIVSSGKWTGADGPVAFACPTQEDLADALGLSFVGRQVRYHLAALEAAQLIRVGTPAGDDALRAELWKYQDAGLILRGVGRLPNVYHVLQDPRQVEAIACDAGPRRRPRRRRSKARRDPLPMARRDQPTLQFLGAEHVLTGSGLPVDGGSGLPVDGGSPLPVDGGSPLPHSTLGGSGLPVDGGSPLPHSPAHHYVSNNETQQQHGRGEAVDVVVVGAPDRKEKAGQALAQLGFWEEHIPEYVQRPGLALIAARLYPEVKEWYASRGNPTHAGLLRRMIEKPGRYGIHQPHDDPDDPYEGWRPSGDSALAKSIADELAAKAPAVEPRIDPEALKREAAETARAAELKRKRELALEVARAERWERLTPEQQSHWLSEVLRLSPAYEKTPTYWRIKAAAMAFPDEGKP